MKTTYYQIVDASKELPEPDNAIIGLSADGGLHFAVSDVIINKEDEGDEDRITHWLKRVDGYVFSANELKRLLNDFYKAAVTNDVNMFDTSEFISKYLKKQP